MKTNGLQGGKKRKKKHRKKQKEHCFRKNIKSSQKFCDKWKKRGDYGKHMQDVTYFCGLSGVRISLLDTLLCAWQLYFVQRTFCILNVSKKKKCSKGEEIARVPSLTSCLYFLHDRREKPEIAQ